MPYGYNKPAGTMLIYPVLSDHMGSFKNLLSEEVPTEEQLDRVRIHKHISENSSPVFMVHTSNDRTVNVKNPLELATVCAEKGILFELHVYPDAPHGAALANEITMCGNPKYNYPAMSKWIENAVEWAETIE